MRNKKGFGELHTDQLHFWTGPVNRVINHTNKTPNFLNKRKFLKRLYLIRSLVVDGKEVLVDEFLINRYFQNRVE